jgi:hypothetical protein
MCHRLGTQYPRYRTISSCILRPLCPSAGSFLAMICYVNSATFDKCLCRFDPCDVFSTTVRCTVVCLILCWLDVDAGTPQALLQSCVSFGVFSYILENLNKPRPVMAATLNPKSRRSNKERHGLQSMQSLVPVLPPFSLPPPMHGPLSLFCNENLHKILSWQQSRPF